MPRSQQRPAGTRWRIARGFAPGLCAIALGLWTLGALAAQPPPPDSLETTLALAPDVQHGAALFAICAKCHGAHGEGYVSGWPPQIAGQHPRVIISELIHFRDGLRWYDPMKRIAGEHVLHTPQDIADVAAYAGSLAPSAATATGSGKWLAQGATRYTGQCAACHGAAGEGSNARLVPRVADQQYEYLLRQLYDCLEGRRPDMWTEHHALLQAFTADDFPGTADYMSRLGRPAAVPPPAASGTP